MKISIDKILLLEKFLDPISRVTDDCSIHITPTNVYALVNDLTGNIILYSNLNTTSTLENNIPIKLNVKDVKKLIKVFSCINQDVIEFEVDKNVSTLKYKSPEISFKLHLVTDSVIRKGQISLEKLSKLTFDTSFVLTKDKIAEILKGSVFTSESNKVYFSMQNGSIYVELTDRALQDTDSLTLKAADVVVGTPLSNALPFNLEVLRLISSNKADSINVRINLEYKIILFEIKNNTYVMKYIMPAYVK